jgi:hypothetical protein
MEGEISFRKRLIADAFIIILSVLLALFLNEWRSNIKENKKTKKALEYVKLEIKDNYEIAKKVKIYHQKVLQNIREIQEFEKPQDSLFSQGKFLYNILAPNGVIQDDFSDIAWDVAKQENISARIEFLESKLLFAIYEQQATVNETIDRIVIFLGNRLIHRKELLLESLVVLEDEFNELVGQEKNLIQLYEIANKEL